MYLKTKFPRISDVKIKEGVTVGPQIRQLIQDAKFKYQLTEVYKSSLEIIKKCHKYFFERVGGIIRQKIIVVRCLILYNTIKLHSVICFKGTFIRLALRVLPRKSRDSKRRAQRCISPANTHHTKAVPRQVQSQYVG
jgi:hypothetical protein